GPTQRLRDGRDRRPAADGAGSAEGRSPTSAAGRGGRAAAAGEEAQERPRAEGTGRRRRCPRRPEIRIHLAKKSTRIRAPLARERLAPERLTAPFAGASTAGARQLAESVLSRTCPECQNQYEDEIVHCPEDGLDLSAV